MKRILTIVMLLLVGSAFAQIQQPIKWSYSAKKTSNRQAILYIKATIEKGWHIYSTAQPEGGPLKTSFSFEPGNEYQLIGKIVEPKPGKKFEKAFDMDVLYFESSVIFSQKIQLKKGLPIIIKGKFEYMVCTDEQCLPPDEVTFSIPIK